MSVLSLFVTVTLILTVLGRNIADFWNKQPEFEVKGNVLSRAGKCGIRPFDHGNSRDVNQDRIVKGQFASYGEFPWHVSLDLLVNKTRFRYCGASILNEFWLLTAAHCVTVQPSWYYVTAANHHWTKPDRHEQSFYVEKIVSHERFQENGTGIDYDIALVKIKSVSGRGIQFNNYVQPVCLPASRTPPKAGTKCLTAGWGHTKDPSYDNSPLLLKKAELAIITEDACQQIFNNVTDRMLCAGNPQERAFMCMGDSGGGLVYKSRGAYTLVGATIAGAESCDQPTVFANVNNLLPWITSQLNLNSNSLEESVLPERPSTT